MSQELRDQITALSADIAGLYAAIVGGKKGDDYAAAMATFQAEKAAKTAELGKLRKELTAAAKEEKAAEKAAEKADAIKAARASIAAAQGTLRARFVYASQRNEAYDTATKIWLSMPALVNTMAHAMPLDNFGDAVRADKLLTTDPLVRLVVNERSVPGSEDLIVERDGNDWLNTWKPSDLVPAQGTAKPMIDHILYLCDGDMTKAGHILDWLAYAYQHPGAKINHALLVISEHQGVGKDTVFQALRRLFGASNTVEINEDMLAGQFNAWSVGKQIGVCPEIMSGDRGDIANKLKPLITQPTIQLREMGKSHREVENHINLLMFSNHLNAAKIEDHDRRYFVVICRAAPQSASYYDRLYDYIRGPELAGFAWFLKNRDLSMFDPAASAPHTADKDAVREATRAGWEAWLEAQWEDCRGPFKGDVINLPEALEVFANMRAAPRFNLNQLSDFLKRKGGGNLDKVRLGPKRQIRLWAVRDFDKVKAHGDLPTLYKDEARLPHLMSLDTIEARRQAARDAIEAEGGL